MVMILILEMEKFIPLENLSKFYKISHLVSDRVEI